MRAEKILAELLTGRNLTLATAESLTGGQVGQLITSVPGASAFYKGGIISYATAAKEQVLQVNADILATHGPVSHQTAEEMADNVRKLFSASVGLSTTGVAGPTKQDGHPVGTLYVGVATESGTRHFRLMGPTDGSRNDVRSWAADTALGILVDTLSEGRGRHPQ